MRRLLKIGAATIVAVAVIAGGLYLFGARIEMDGGGGFHLRFVDSPGAQARRIEEHRRAQHAAAAAIAVPPPAPSDSPPGTDSTPAPGSVPVTPMVVPASWPGFRGPLRDGRYLDRPVLATWPVEGLTPMWKQPSGAGYASFAVAGGRAFTIEQRGDREVVAAYEIATGREVWTHAWDAAFRELMGGDGPRATPTWFDGSLYALGATGELRRLDAATGRVVWRTNILQDAGADNLPWGMAGSPLIVDDTVIVQPGGSNGRSVVAYDRRTGARRWSAHDDKQAYASPMLATIAGERQLIVFSASRVMGLSPSDGALRWQHPWTTQYDMNASQPMVIGANRVFVSSGYGTGATVIELTRAGDAFQVREVWRNIRMKNQFNSSVLRDGFIYGLDEAILACIDAATGAVKWKGGRYGYGQVVLAGDRLIVLTETGDLVLVAASPDEHSELARFSALEGKTWNHPAFADGILLVRNLREMAAFDLRR